MCWNLDRPKTRVRKRAEACKSSSYTVVDLMRDRDFYNLSPTTICRVKGAHIYVDVTNSHVLVAEAGGDKLEQKKLIRRLSVRRLQSELADENNVGKIQLQGARFHGMCHKPYDGEQIDTKRPVSNAPLPSPSARSPTCTTYSTRSSTT